MLARHLLGRGRRYVCALPCGHVGQQLVVGHVHPVRRRLLLGCHWRHSLIDLHCVRRRHFIGLEWCLVSCHVRPVRSGLVLGCGGLDELHPVRAGHVLADCRSLVCGNLHRLRVGQGVVRPRCLHPILLHGLRGWKLRGHRKRILHGVPGWHGLGRDLRHEQRRVRQLRGGLLLGHVRLRNLLPLPAWHLLYGRRRRVGGDLRPLLCRHL